MLTLFLAASLIASGCGSDDTESSDPPPGADGSCDTSGGTLSMGVFSETSGLDPTVSNGGGTTGGSELAAIYDTLMRWDTDASEYVPGVASSLEADDSFTTWTMTLREGVLFGNGDELVADHVVDSVGRHLGEESGSPVAGLASTIESVTATDDTSVEFVLAEGWSGFPFLLAGPLGMVTNQSVIDELGAEAFNQLPVGGGVGPFEPVRFAVGEEIVMDARSDYWAGEPCLDSLRFVAIPGGDGTLDALDSGEIDVAFLREPLAINRSRGDGYAEHVDLKNMGTVILINSGVRESTPPTTDVRVRQAIAAAIDPTAIDERVNEGFGLPGSAIFSEDSRWFDGLTGPEYDLDRATALVEEVKAEGEWDGSIRLVCDNSPNRVETGIAVEGQLEAAGFTVDLDTSATISDLIDEVIINANFELACWGLNTYEEEAWAPLADYVSTDGGANRSGYSNAAIDSALDDLRVAPTTADQLAAIAEIQAAWNDTVPHVVLDASEEVIAWSEGVSGLDFTRDTIVLFDRAEIAG